MLLGLGVRRGDRVGLLLLNSVAFMELTFATAKLGAIVVPINFRLQGPEVGYILDDAGCDVFVYHRTLADLARAGLEQSSGRARHRVLVDAPPGWPGVDGSATAADELAGTTRDLQRRGLVGDVLTVRAHPSVEPTTVVRLRSSR